MGEDAGGGTDLFPRLLFLCQRQAAVRLKVFWVLNFPACSGRLAENSFQSWFENRFPADVFHNLAQIPCKVGCTDDGNKFSDTLWQPVGGTEIHA